MPDPEGIAEPPGVCDVWCIMLGDESVYLGEGRRYRSGDALAAATCANVGWPAEPDQTVDWVRGAASRLLLPAEAGLELPAG
jgi:hypothetical protein